MMIEAYKQIKNLSETTYDVPKVSIANTFALRYLYAYKVNNEPIFSFADCLYNLERGRTIKRDKLLFNDGKDKDNDYKLSKILEKSVTNFVTNLLLFFNEPRVVTYIFNRPQKNREKKGLIPIPSEIRTKIHIDLKDYIEKIYFTGESHSKLGFAFWVMGHNRILKSDYYINKKGEKIWIPAHIRGEGLMPPQVFEVTK
jgi:hypothetical protein